MEKWLYTTGILLAIIAMAFSFHGKLTPVTSVSAGNCVSTNSCNLSDASDFAQYCSANTSTCSKVDQSGTSGSASCPDETQTIDAVYVHAGNGQTVDKLPDPTNYSETFSDNNATVTVDVLGTGPSHPDLSWIGVICSNPTTPTPTVTSIPTPTTDPCANNTCVTPTATPTPTVTVTNTPTPTPTNTPSGCTDNCGSSNTSGGSSSSSNPTQAVLGASTMAGTGTFTTSLMNILLTFGMMVLGAGVVSYAKEKNR